jgi:hypothetical protein
MPGNILVLHGEDIDKIENSLDYKTRVFLFLQQIGEYFVVKARRLAAINQGSLITSLKTLSIFLVEKHWEFYFKHLASLDLTRIEK